MLVLIVDRAVDFNTESLGGLKDLDRSRDFSLLLLIELFALILRSSRVDLTLEVINSVGFNNDSLGTFIQGFGDLDRSRDFSLLLLIELFALILRSSRVDLTL